MIMLQQLVVVLLPERLVSAEEDKVQKIDHGVPRNQCLVVYHHYIKLAFLED